MMCADHQHVDQACSCHKLHGAVPTADHLLRARRRLDAQPVQGVGLHRADLAAPENSVRFLHAVEIDADFTGLEGIPVDSPAAQSTLPTAMPLPSGRAAVTRLHDRPLRLTHRRMIPPSGLRLLRKQGLRDD